jgi:hypothetical protein
MHVGQLVRIELFSGRCVDATVRCIFTQKGIEKLRVQYGSSSFAVILANEAIVPSGRPAVTERPCSSADEGVSF